METQGAFDVSVIVPVFNEEGAITRTLAALRTTLQSFGERRVEIICVDDGSKDGTAGILLAESDVTVITHGVNRGYGAALRTGLDHARGEWVIIVDADGTYPLEQLPELMERASGTTQMVVGARRGPGIDDRRLHVLARWFLRQLVRSLTGVFVPDLNSGMRVFRRDLYEEFRHLLPMGFSFTTTLTVASLYSGYRVEYVPIRYDKRIGHSNIKPVRDFLRFVMLVVRLASYFEPLKFFLPTAATILVLATARAVRDLVVTNGIGSFAVLLVVLGLQVFFVGILADVVVRRSETFHRSQRRSASDVRMARGRPAAAPEDRA